MIESILRKCTDGVTRSEICRSTGLSDREIDDRLCEMARSGSVLIKSDGKRVTYRLRPASWCVPHGRDET